MRLPNFIRHKLLRRATALIKSRAPDQIIGGDSPYLKRWYVIPRNRLFNIYVHQFLRSDDDRALHDHPWINLSVLLHGRYEEITRDWLESWWTGGPAFRSVIRSAGGMKVRLPWKAHRLGLINDQPCITLFITGPKMRAWGFHCPKSSPAGGWRHWKQFTDPANPGRVGPGCE